MFHQYSQIFKLDLPSGVSVLRLYECSIGGLVPDAYL